MLYKRGKHLLQFWIDCPQKEGKAFILFRQVFGAASLRFESRCKVLNSQYQLNSYDLTQLDLEYVIPKSNPKINYSPRETNCLFKRF
jgi:hypothetical protein